MIAREIDQLDDKNSIYNGLTEDMQNDILNTEIIHDIIESFTDLKLEEDGLMKLGNVYTKKEKVEGALTYIDMPIYA